jgi:hypothetical protein
MVGLCEIGSRLAQIGGNIGCPFDGTGEQNLDVRPVAADPGCKGKTRSAAGGELCVGKHDVDGEDLVL